MNQVSVIQLAKKRFVYLASAIIIVAVVPELLQDSFNWKDVLQASQAPLAYWLITVFRDYQDPAIPNTVKSIPEKGETIERG